jgi:hypothetical protein
MPQEERECPVSGGSKRSLSEAGKYYVLSVSMYPEVPRVYGPEAYVELARD